MHMKEEMERISYVETQVQMLYDMRLGDMTELRSNAKILLGVITAILASVTGYAVDLLCNSSLDDLRETLALVFALICVLLYLSWLAVSLAKDVFSPEPYLPKGNEPQSLMSETADALSLCKLRIEECKSYEERLKIISERNGKIALSLKKAFSRFVLTPVVALTSLFVVKVAAVVVDRFL